MLTFIEAATVVGIQTTEDPYGEYIDHDGDEGDMEGKGDGGEDGDSQGQTKPPEEGSHDIDPVQAEAGRCLEHLLMPLKY